MSNETRLTSKYIYGALTVPTIHWSECKANFYRPKPEVRLVICLRHYVVDITCVSSFNKAHFSSASGVKTPHTDL